LVTPVTLQIFGRPPRQICRQEEMWFRPGGYDKRHCGWERINISCIRLPSRRLQRLALFDYRVGRHCFYCRRPGECSSLD